MLDVVIVTYNRPGFLSKMLDVLEVQISPVSVIVSDDGGDQVLDWRVYHCVRKYLWTKHDKYRRVACYNEAIQYLESPHVILLDDDVIPQSMYWSQGFEELIERYDVIRGAHAVESDRVILPPWFSTNNVCFKHGLWKTGCLFDPIYDGEYGYEDVDVGKEVESAKMSVGVGDARTLAIHIGTPMNRNGDRNKALFVRKWGL